MVSTKKYKKVDKKQLNADFEHAPWHLVSLFDYIDDCPLIWNSFPFDWKLSCATPVFKKGNPCDLNNYRPISLLSIPGEVLEAVVCNSNNDRL